MKILCVFGQHNYGDAARGEGYEYSNFLPALRALGHEVELFDSFSRVIHSDFADLNRSLLLTVERFRPDIVFCVLMGYEVWRETLELIRESGAKLINWGTDDSWKYDQFTRFVSKQFDVWVTTSYDAYQAAMRDGLRNIHYSQWAASASRLAEPLPSRNCRHKVSFIGSAYGNRPKWISRLKRRGVDVECFGHGWPGGSLPADRIPEIVRESIVSLNFSDSGLCVRGLKVYRSRQIKARVFEVPGAGGCLLTESAGRLDDYYVLGHEIDVFSDVDELARKIVHLLGNPVYRDAMAWAGYKRTAAEHTYEARFKDMLGLVQVRGSAEPVNIAKFDSIARVHRVGRGARILRAVITSPFRLVLGKRRGPRAARRLLFELSWRLVGMHTYTAAGLPGRLFYHES